MLYVPVFVVTNSVLIKFLQVGENCVESIEQLFQILDQKNVVGLAPKLFLHNHMAKHFNYQQVGLYHLTKTEFRYNRSFWVFNNTIAKILNKKLE